jgi:hypothetical protein
LSTIKPVRGKACSQTFLGKPVVVDDSLPVSNGVYTTYIFPVLAHLAGAKAELLYRRDRTVMHWLVTTYSFTGDTFILHPRGVAFKNVNLSDGNGGTNATPFK